MQDYFLSDDVIGLRGLLQADLLGGYKNWLNDEVTCAGNSHFRYYNSVEDLECYIKSVANSKSNLVMAVCLLESNLHIGNIALQNISYIDRSCDISFLLGESKCRGQGIMFRAANLLIGHAFRNLNMRRVSCGTLHNNVAMVSLAEKLGMVQEGVRRQSIFKDGKYLDVYEYGILKSEWKTC